MIEMLSPHLRRSAMQAGSNDPHAISPTAVHLVMHFEGLSLSQYDDVAGNPTIGYGHKIGPNEHIMSPISQQQAQVLLARDLAAAGDVVNRFVTVPVNQNQFDALVSFVFNVGASAFEHSTLLGMLNNRDYQGAADQLLKWNHAVINGSLYPVVALTERRKAERALFMEPPAGTAEAAG